MPVVSGEKTETPYETRFHRLFETAKDGILILNGITGEITDVNPFLRELLKYSEAELLGKKLWEIGLFEDEEKSAIAYRELQTNGYIRYEDLPLKTKDGQRRDVEFVSNVYYVNGERVIQCNIRDITDRKRMKEQMTQYAQALKHSNDELEEFASIAAHDLREPLRKISLLGDFLKNDYAASLAPEAQGYIDTMQAASRTMHQLVESLLLYASLSHGPVLFEDVDLRPVVEQVVADLGVRIMELNAEIVIEALPIISANPIQMKQLFQNLIANSLKFSQKDKAPRIAVGSTAAPDGWVELWVQDNGIGFDERYLSKVFQPFRQLHPRKEYGGVGLGLAICKKVAERHGGRIFARSVPLQGSVFVIILPATNACRKLLPTLLS